MAKPTNTTNRLPFGELEPRRFEDLCLGLIYGSRAWADIRHYGRSGADEGVDIWAQETLDNGEERVWHTQCRRYNRATAETLKKAVDDACSGPELPDVVLVIVGCDVSRRAHEAFQKHASKKGIQEAVLWPASLLEAKLYSERRDLLFAYFGIPMARDSRSREASVRRSLNMKRKLRRKLRKEKYEDPRELLYHPYRKFRYSKAIIRSVDECTYPNIDARAGLSSWFGHEFFDEYHNGIEFIINIDLVALRDDGKWAIAPYDYKPKSSTVFVAKAWHTGCIPYRNIVEVDFEGDEYYREPHFYCRFSEAGSPYEAYRYRLCEDGEYPEVFMPEDRLELVALDCGAV